MDELCLEQLDKLDEMLRAVDIRLEGFVDRRIEVDDAGQIHDDVNFPFKLADPVGADSAQGLVKIAFQHCHLLPHRIDAAQAFYGAPERRRTENVGKEPLFSGEVLFSPHLDDQMSKFRETVENHRQENFADKTRSAHQKHRAVAESLDGGDFAGSLKRLPWSGLVFSADRVPSPGRE